MSIFGIASSILGQIGSATPQNPNRQQFKEGFQLLGQDLQSGNLAQAQTDFSSLQQLIPGGQQNSPLSPAYGASNTNPLAAAVSQLARDLKSGNLSAAQSDFSAVQQELQQVGSRLGGPQGHHHRHHGGGESSQSSSQQDPITKVFGQLGQDLQAGNISAAQQAYASLQQDFQQFAANSTPGASSAASGAGFSVSA